MIDHQALKNYVLGKEVDQNALKSSIDDIVNLVYHRYFKGYGRFSEFKIIGEEKIYDLLHTPHIDPTRNIVNFLFTGTRNEMSNFVRREKRFEHVEKDMPVKEAVVSEVPFENDDFLFFLKKVIARFEFVGISMGILNKAILEREHPRGDLNEDEENAILMAAMYFAVGCGYWDFLPNKRIT